VPRAMLPEVVPSLSSAAFGRTRADGPFGAELPLAAVLGDQQAALFGQGCFEPGEAKNTYGTGCFLLLQTGSEAVPSRHGLLTTVAWQREGEAPRYALEGSVAVAGALVQWLRDRLGLIASSAEIETLAASVEDSGGVVFVPAFSGLFAPHWRADARGVVCGLTAYAERGHLARAALEAAAFQTFEVLEAMEKDAGVRLAELRVDGGMCVNDLLMQFQADLLGVPVTRPEVLESTARGAAFAAGLMAGVWPDEAALREVLHVERRFEPGPGAAAREGRLAAWRKGVERSLGWAD